MEVWAACVTQWTSCLFIVWGSNLGLKLAEILYMSDGGFRRQGGQKLTLIGATSSASDTLSCGGVFWDCRGFVTTCFHIKVGTGFGFEAKIVSTIYALEVTQTCQLDFIWVEVDVGFF